MSSISTQSTQKAFDQAQFAARSVAPLFSKVQHSAALVNAHALSGEHHHHHHHSH